MKKLALIALVLSACGGDDAAKGTVNTANAKASVENLGKVNSSMMAGNGMAAASAVQAMTSAGQSLVAPSGQAGRQLGLLPASFPRPDIANAIGGTATCTADQCTFTGFGDDTPGNSWSIDGTIKHAGDTTTFNLDYQVNNSGAAIVWHIDGDVTVSATLIDGTVHSNGKTDVTAMNGNPSVNVTYDTTVDYNQITLDAQGCATGGDLHATVSYNVKAGGQSGGSYNVQGGAKFGPACGAVTAD